VTLTLRHDRLELDRDFVKADDGSLGVMRLGIEIEEILHPGDVIAIDLGDAPHLLLPGLQIVIVQPAADRVTRDALVFDQFDQGIGQKFQGPAGATLRGIRASQGHQLHLLLAAQLASRARTRLFTEGGLEADLHKALLGAVDGRAAGLHRCRDGLVADAGVSGKQDLHPLEPSHRQFTSAHHGAEFVSFGLAEINSIS
jgi:hypothetical protein